MANLKIQIYKRHTFFSKLTPTKIIVLSFLSVILIGTILLMLPVSSVSGNPTDFLDALFTSTSATCVTGLVTVDTYSHWSGFGKLIIILLIQIGGLGIITLATFFAAMIKRKFSLSNLQLALESTSLITFHGLSNLVKKLVAIVFTIELVGAFMLSLVFVPKYGFLNGLANSFFTAISAFCNAGFDITGKNYTSVIEFQQEPLVLLTICGLIIIGGLGFIVWSDLFSYTKNKKLSLHSKMAITVTAILLAGGTIFYFFVEGTNTLSNLPTVHKWINAFFASTTARTCGFASIDYAKTSDASKIFTSLLMFIGASSGSTGGGIKVTTFGVLVMAVISQIKGKPDTVAFKSKISSVIVNRAVAITMLSAFIVATASFLISLLDPAILSKSASFVDAVFASSSAYATVGLASCMINELSDFSKYVLIFCMFLGRTGPLSFMVALSFRNSKKNDNRCIPPEGRITVG